MNIVFLASAQFAVPSLKILLSTNHRISSVLTQPDKQKGRGLSMAGTPIKNIALEEGLKLYQPVDINAPESVKILKELNPDLLVVIAYGQILSQEVLNIPRIFAVNLHGSILPRYRGAAPINWAIINGDSTTGVTIIKMVRQMDAGPIILQKEVAIADADTSLSLEDRLSDLGSHLLLQSLKAIENGNYSLIPQDGRLASLAPKLKKEDGLIKWDKPAQDICNLIRGCVSWPGAFTYCQGKLLKIYKVKVLKLTGLAAGHNCGEIIKVARDGLYVFTGRDILMVEELQIEGKRRMTAEEFISGSKTGAGEILGNKN